MKRWIAVAALALLVTQAGAQTTPNQVYDGTRWRPRTGTDTGATKIHDIARDRDAFRDGNTAIIDDTTAVGMADSSAVISMGPYRLLGLAIRMVGNPADTATCIIQVRYHLNQQSDTASVFPIYFRSTQGAAVADSVVHGGVISPLTAAPSSNEFVVRLVNNAGSTAKWGNPANALIMLRDVMGTEIWAPYISVRIRLAATSMQQAPPVSPTFKVYLIGTPL